jgi:hypothetical protein
VVSVADPLRSLISVFSTGLLLILFILICLSLLVCVAACSCATDVCMSHES